MKRIKDIGEQRLIERFRHRYKTSDYTIVGIGDDGAVLKASGKKLLVFTTDTLIEGVHFQRKRVTGHQIGRKALGAALSDIAAMAASPKAGVVSLGLPKNLTTGFVNGLMEGIERLANYFNLDIVGGDTVESPKGILISISILGEVERKCLTRRRGARLRDKILVTGLLGGSRFKKQFSFIPRIKEAQWLVRHAKIHSVIDVTDGLALDLYKMVTESRVGARLYKQAIPISKDAYRSRKPFRSALEDGEDFELVFTTSSISAKRLLKAWPYKDVPLTVIGEVIPGKGKLELVDKYGRCKKLVPKGYEHFNIKL